MRRALPLLAVLLALPAAAQAHAPATAPTAGTAAASELCPGDPIRLDQPGHRLIRVEPAGELRDGPVRRARRDDGRAREVLLRPAGDPRPSVRHALDLGIHDPRGFRGWGGSSHSDVTLSAEGFSSEAQYRAGPKGYEAALARGSRAAALGVSDSHNAGRISSPSSPRSPPAPPRCTRRSCRSAGSAAP